MELIKALLALLETRQRKQLTVVIYLKSSVRLFFVLYIWAKLIFKINSSKPKGYIYEHKMNELIGIS